MRNENIIVMQRLKLEIQSHDWGPKIYENSDLLV